MRCRVRPSLMMLVILFATAALSQSKPQPEGQPDAQPYLYRASLVQAAPGKLTELIDEYKRLQVAPLWMRHSQGDRWDLLVLEPMGSYESYYAPARIAARQQPERISAELKIKLLTAWREDEFVFGPQFEELQKAFRDAGFFHVEMFHALANDQGPLIKERLMENAYAKAIGQPENFIFIRDQGASWDVFTIGCFRDLKHYASSADVPPEKAQAAAKAAGFDSPAAIGPYLRQFIADHHDTLAVAVR